MPHPDIRIRERRAPRPRITTGVGGWARVSLVDRAGRERVVAEQHNLILNNGMDLIGDSSVQFDVGAALTGAGAYVLVVLTRDESDATAITAALTGVGLYELVVITYLAAPDELAVGATFTAGGSYATP